MNAPVRSSHLTPLGDIYDFVEVCDDNAWFYTNGWITLQRAVDNLQWLADRWRLPELYGQDFIQGLIAYNSTIEPLELSEYETGYIQRIITQWEAADAARPRPAARTADQYLPAISTIDAFFTVARSQPAEYLARWLSEHPQDAPHLHKLWIEHGQR